MEFIWREDVDEDYWGYFKVYFFGLFLLLFFIFLLSIILYLCSLIYFFICIFWGYYLYLDVYFDYWLCYKRRCFKIVLVGLNVEFI